MDRLMTDSQCKRCKAKNVFIYDDNKLCSNCTSHLRSINFAPSLEEKIMLKLELDAQWSTCQRLFVASKIVTADGDELLSAVNNPPRFTTNCNIITESDGNTRCTNCIHSEKHIINIAVRNGIKIAGHNLYTLYRPCISCANDLVDVGIGSITYRWDYDSDGQRERVVKLFSDCSVYVNQRSMSDTERKFSEQIKQWRKTWMYQ